MIISREFPANYEVNVLAESPQPPRLPHYYFPGGSLKGGRDGILLRVTPRGAEPWIGTFAFGENGLTGVFATPNPDRLLVVAKGAGYLIRVSDPTHCDAVRASPVLDVRPVTSHELVVIADYTDLCAYGRSSLVWRTDRLCLDELKITEVTDSVIRGSGSEREIFGAEPFEVNLMTGRHTGGLRQSS